GRAVKGPTVALMRAVGAQPDAVGVAQLYQDLASGFVLDRADAAQEPAIRALGYRMVSVDTLLDDPTTAARVAVAALRLVEERAAA
ncbi:MAG TPA: hypothetical protein VET65_05020, partial [Candidatus Limnocylindrales bacterium]|nr:hypothetical protein [Candidatus Limnocylindrales bacterium]